MLRGVKMLFMLYASLSLRLLETGSLNNGTVTCDSWEKVLVSDPFLTLVGRLLPGKKLDIFVSPACVTPLAPILATFSKRIGKTVVIISINPDDASVKISHRPEDIANDHLGLLVACDIKSLQTLKKIPYERYTALVLVVSELLTTKLHSNKYFRRSHCNYWIFTMEEGMHRFRRNYEITKNCFSRRSFYSRTSHSTEEIIEMQHFQMQADLTNRTIAVLCYADDDCNESDTRTLVEVLSIKGAKVCISHGNKAHKHYTYALKKLTDGVFDIFLCPTVCWFDLPFVFVPGYYGWFKFSLYTKARSPVPKEAVLVLPFSVEVWILFTLSVITMVGFALLVIPQTRERFADTIFFYLTSALTPGIDVPRFIMRKSFMPILVASWCFGVFVLSTGYRAQLITLLSETPLSDGIHNIDTLQKYAKSEDIMGACVLNSFVAFKSAFNHIKLGVPIWAFPTCPYHASTELSPYNFVFISEETSPTDLVATLPEDYVRSQELPFTLIHGPLMRRTSRLRSAVTSTLSQSIESGLFQRARDVEFYRKNLKRGLDKSSNLVSPFTTANLKLFVVVWAVGLMVSFLAFLVEHLCFNFRVTPLRNRGNI